MESKIDDSTARFLTVISPLVHRASDRLGTGFGPQTEALAPLTSL